MSVHPLCTAKAIDVARQLTIEVDQYLYHKRLYAIPSVATLRQIEKDLEFMIGNCITENSRGQFEAALSLVREAIRAIEAKNYDYAMDRLKQALAQLDLGSATLKHGWRW